jgi:hypothetical protein
MSVESSPILAAANSGELFRQILPHALLGVLAIIALHAAGAILFRRGPASRRRWNLWDRLIYLGTIGSVGLLGTTAFGAVMRDGALAGWPLFLHMFGAGAFTAILPLVALSWSDANCRQVRCAEGEFPPAKFYWLAKLMFWLIIPGGLVVTTSMLVSMLPIFGSDDLRTLLDVHRYSGLVVVVATALHLYGVVAWRFRSKTVD